MTLDKKIRYLFVALLCMSGFYYAFERPGVFWQLTSGVVGKQANGPSEQFGCWIGDLKGGSGEGSSATDGETPDWFKNLASDDGKGEPDADTIARARQLQEEQWSREINKSPRGRLLNTTISDARLPALNFSDTVVAGTTFINCQLPNFQASGVTFKNVRFYRVEMDKARFADCVFESCTFENTRLDDATLKETVFKGGSFKMLPEQTVRSAILPGIYRASLEKVTFDGTAFLDAPLDRVDGEITMLNLKEVRFKHSAAPLISGAGLRLRLEDSSIDGAKFAMLKNSKLRLSSCTFTGSTVSNTGSLLAENCSFDGGTALQVSGLALLRKSRLKSASVEQGQLFITDCEITLGASEADSLQPPKFSVGGKGELYMLDNSGDYLWLSNNGSTSISGLHLKGLYMENGAHQEAAALNLCDVRADSASIRYTRLRRGDWLDVSIAGAKLGGSKAEFGNLRLRNVDAPFLKQIYSDKLPETSNLSRDEIKIPDDSRFAF